MLRPILRTLIFLALSFLLILRPPWDLPGIQAFLLGVGWTAMAGVWASEMSQLFTIRVARVKRREVQGG